MQMPNVPMMPLALQCLSLPKIRKTLSSKSQMLYTAESINIRFKYIYDKYTHTNIHVFIYVRKYYA